MNKLKKLFPISFKFCGNIGKLAIGIILYILFAVAVSIVIPIVFGIVSGALSAPMMIFAIPYVGWVLAIICLPIILLMWTVLMLLVIAEILTFALAYIYVIAGIAVTFVAYANTPEEPFSKKPKKEVAPKAEADPIEE